MRSANWVIDRTADMVLGDTEIWQGSFQED